jgi:purine-binding chemotaxis protein CheW
MPKSEALVLGVTGYRDGLLPLLSLRGLLGFKAAPADGGGKVVITSVNGLLVGLVVDRMGAILSAEPSLIEPTPSVLAARTTGEAQITAIYRGEGGQRLVPILAPDRLFREDIMQRLGTASETARPPAATGASDEIAESRYLVFRLGDEEYGLPIEAVDEVASAPDRLTRVPKAPSFLEGVINFRGKVLPVIDQRKRFDMPPMEAAEKRRLVVVRTERHRAGLIVDSVSEVLAARAADLEPAPDIAGEASRLVEDVLNLDGLGRMILVLNPAELLSRAERGLLDTFQDRQDGA